MEVIHRAGAEPCRCSYLSSGGGRRRSVVAGEVLRRVEPVRRRWRRATAALRVLPDFVIVGAQKAGTSSLYAYLAAESQVLPASTKEVHFLDTCAWDAGPAAYRSFFPLRAHVWLAERLRRTRVITGEATPYYLFHPLAAQRLHSLVPDAKIIILLRDPAERSLSHYWHEVRGRRENLPLAEALAAEESRLRGREEAIAAGEPPCLHLEHRNFSYQDRSRYSRQVARYLDLFGAEQVLVLKSEELFSDDPRAKARLAQFLGLPELTRPMVAKNVGDRATRRDPEEESIRRALATDLADDQKALQALVGDEFGW